MMPGTVDTTGTDAPLPMDIDPEAADIHPEAARILTVVYGAASALEVVHDAEGAASEELAQTDVDVLEAAVATGQRLLDHAAYPAFTQSGLAGLPEDFAGEVYQDLTPIAPVVCVELTPPDAVGEQHNTGGNQ